MTKQAVIAVVVGVFIILAAGGAFLYSQSKPSVQKPNTTTATEVTKAPENSMAQSTIKDILTSGKSSKCTFTTETDKSQTTGTVYTSGKNARGDFQSTVGGKDTSTHMIRNDDTFYMWGDSIAMGVKMVMSVDDLASKMEGNKDFGSFNPDQQMDIKCATWTQDATLFTPPSNVKFTSIGNMMPTGSMMKTSAAPTSAGSGSSDNSNQCNICNSLTGQAKSACVAQFNCQ